MQWNLRPAGAVSARLAGVTGMMLVCSLATTTATPRTALQELSPVRAWGGAAVAGEAVEEPLLPAGAAPFGGGPAEEPVVPWVDVADLRFARRPLDPITEPIPGYTPFEAYDAVAPRRHYKMSTAAAIATGLTAAGLGGLLLFGDTASIENAGDYTATALPVAGGLAALIKQDWDGLWMYAKSVVVSTGTTHLIKETAEKWRPNGSNQQSFPSGHTQGAFTGASFLDTRYGHDYGIPAYITAAFTGVSRVVSQNHFSDDVLSGASIALLTNFYFVKPIDTNASISPMFTEDGYGISVRMSPGSSDSPRDRAKEPGDDFVRQFRFTWEFGSAWTETNLNQAPANLGNEVDFTSFGTDANPTTSARATFDWFLDHRSRLSFVATPFETRESATLGDDTTFAGQTFQAGEGVQSRYLLSDFILRYAYALTTAETWVVLIGAGMNFQFTDVELIPSDGSANGRASDTSIAPVVYAHAGYHFNEHFELYLESDLMPFGSSDWIDANLSFRYHINPRWEVGLGYRYVNRQLDSAALINDLEISQVLLAFAHSF